MLTDLSQDIVSSTIACFEELRLNDLDETWVSDAVRNDFISYEEYPTPVEFLYPDDVMPHLQKALTVSKKWLELHDIVDEEDLPVLWTVLNENNIEVKNIQALVFLLCSKCQRLSASLFEKQCGLIISQFYLNLLQVPGSNAYSVYHPALVRVVVSCLILPKEKPHGRRRAPVSVHRNDVISARRRVQRDNNDSESDADDQGAGETNDNDAETEFSERDCQKLFSSFIPVLRDLLSFLKTFSLKNDDETLEDIITKFGQCVGCEKHHTDYDFSKDVDDIVHLERRYGPTYVITGLAFKGLLLLCDSLHCVEYEIYLLVLEKLCDHLLLFRAKQASNQSILHQFIVVKDNTVNFICYNLKICPEFTLIHTRTLLQQMCIRVIDKTDFRLKVAQAFVAIARQFPIKEYALMIKWLNQLVNHNRTQDRVMALEILSLLLVETERDDASKAPQRLATYASYVPIADAIVLRCSDKASTVRSKAMSILAVNLAKIMRVLSGISITSKPQAESESEVSSSSSLSMDLESDVEPEPQQDVLTAEQRKEKLDMLVNLISIRIGDPKVFTRKAAFQTLEQLICLEKRYISAENLERFLDAATDPNVTMKKACLCSISSILNQYKTNKLVQNYWIRAVLPLITEPEKTVQAKALEVMENELLINISGSTSERNCAWNILNELACGEHHSFARFLFKAFVLWKVESKLRSNLRGILEQELSTENKASAWMMLQMLSDNVEVKQTAIISDSWMTDFKNDNVHSFTKVNMLRVISNVCRYISQDTRKKMQEELEQDIRGFQCSTDLASYCIDTLFKLYEIQTTKEDSYRRLISQFASEIMKVSETFLSSVVLEKRCAAESDTEDLICRHLVTLGALALMCPQCIPAKTSFIIQSMVASFHMDDDQHSLSSEHSDGSAKSKKRDKILSEKVRAIAFGTLGKLCILDEELTKKCIPALVCELSNSKSFVIRNNIVVVLTDLCIRYTSAVDLYIPSISACLMDPNTLVRYQTLVNLSRLLQEDYIKWKDSLLFRMSRMVLDRFKNSRMHVEYFLGTMMLKRNPSLFSQSFVECIYYFNAYPRTSRINDYCHFKQDQKLFTLKGDLNRGKRMYIYKFMLRHTIAVKRYATSLKLCKDILGSAADHVLELDEHGKAVLKDCLAVLSSDEIKLPGMLGNNAEDTEETEVFEVIAVKTANKMNLVKNVIPKAIALKKLLEELKSPLLKDLMIFLREVFKDYKTELKDLFASDQKLGKEIEFDIRRYEKECEKENERRHLEDVEVERNIALSSTPARIVPLNNQEVLLQSAERAQHMNRPERLLSIVQRKSLVNRLNSIDAMSADNTDEPIPTDVQVIRYSSLLPSTSAASMQPVVRLDRLSPDVLASSQKRPSPETKKPADPEENNMLLPPETPKSIPEQNKDNGNPSVLITQLSQSDFASSGEFLALSTPLPPQKQGTFVTLTPCTSRRKRSESISSESSSSSSVRMSTRKRKRKVYDSDEFES